MTEEQLASGALYPPLRDLREITRQIARAVVMAARDAGVGRPLTDDQIDDELDREMWDLEYPTLIPM